MDCLLTKLKGTVNDSNLLKLGELQAYIVDANKSFSVNSTSDEQMYAKDTSFALGGEYGSDSQLTMQGYIIIPDKYKITSLQGKSTRIQLNIDDLAYSKNLNSLENVVATKGDLSSLTGKPIIKLSILRGNYTGKVTDLDFSNPERVTLITIKNNSSIKGDISFFSKYPNCELNFSGVDIFGDLSTLPKMSWLVEKVITNNFSWKTERSSDSRIILMTTEVNLGSDVDAMLINQAKCTTLYNNNNNWYNQIRCTGTRTSASDSAITILQGKGITVTVPTATDAKSISLMSVRSNENFGIAYKDKELIVEPVDLTKMQIYPASDVIVKKFDTKENAEQYIKDIELVKA